MAVEQLIGAGVGVIANTISGITTAKKQREVEEKIAKLSLEQQKLIAIRLSEANTEIERQKRLFEILSVEMNKEMLEKIQKDKTKSVLYLSIGLAILGGVIIMVKKQKK